MAKQKRPATNQLTDWPWPAAEIQRLFLEHRQVYGSPRIHAALQARGVRCGRKQVVRLMQTLGLRPFVCLSIDDI